MKKLSATLALLLLALVSVSAQRMAVYSLAFYNQENLFDYEDDPNNKGDDDFLPTGAYQWTQQKYEQKLHNMAYTISQLAVETCPAGPAAIGLAEVENERVVKDLIATKPLSERELKYVHYESPDHRGIDVALLYNPKLFKVLSSKPYPLVYRADPTLRTRDQLLVSGILAGEPVSIIVCHWPSRYGGAKSSPLREAAAALSKHIADSVRRADPKSKVIIMGDLNDDPDNKSCAEVLDAKKDRKDTSANGFYNTTWSLFAKGIGTLCYQNVWNLFDQQIVSGNFLTDKSRKTLTFWKAEVFNRDFLITPSGKYKGYPLRSFSGKVWQNGYSDHFPTITYYVKKID